MKLSRKSRGYVVAAVAMAVCVGTWAAVVSADEGIQRGAGIYRETLGAPVCTAFLVVHAVTLEPGYKRLPLSLCHERR